jgi:hypothetical protein
MIYLTSRCYKHLVEHQGSQLDRLPERCILGRRGVDKRGMRRALRNTLLRVVATREGVSH